MIIAERLLDKRDCTVAKVVTERSDRPKHLAWLLSSLLFVFFVLAVKGSAWTSPTAVTLSVRSFFSLPVFLSLSSSLSLYPSFSAAFLGGFFFLPRSRSILLSPRHSLLHRRESPTTSTGRHDYLWQLRGNITFSSECPRAPVPLLIERD